MLNGILTLNEEPVMLKGSDPNEIKNWVCVLESNTELEAEMAKNYLANMEIPSNILSKRDSAYSLTVGEMALVYLYVPDEYADEAKEALKDWDFSADEYNEEE